MACQLNSDAQINFYLLMDEAWGCSMTNVAMFVQQIYYFILYWNNMSFDKQLGWTAMHILYVQVNKFLWML